MKSIIDSIPERSNHTRPELHGTYAVSGGSTGLGAAVVAAIARAGGMPAIFDVRPPAKRDAPFLPVDVSQRQAVEDAMSRAAAEYGPLRGVVANAGIDACGKLADVDAERWERVVQVNLFGVAAMVRAALRYLPRDGTARIVTVASTLGLRALGDATAYCASKFGVVGFTRALSAELAGEIGVTLLLPGGMHTSFFDDRPARYKPPADARLNAPSKVADAVVFALSQPAGCDVREMLVCPSTESSWP